MTNKEMMNEAYELMILAREMLENIKFSIDEKNVACYGQLDIKTAINNLLSDCSKIDDIVLGQSFINTGDKSYLNEEYVELE